MEGFRNRSASAESSTPRRASSVASHGGIPTRSRPAAASGTGAGIHSAADTPALPFVVDPEGPEFVVAAGDELVGLEPLQIAERRLDDVSHPAAGRGGIGVRATGGLRDDLVHDPERLQ